MNENPEEKDTQKKSNRRFYGRVYPGIWLILIGGIFLLNNFGLLRWDIWGKIWPLFIIITGLFMLFRQRR